MGCASCGKEFEKDKTIIRCDECWMWFHVVCAGTHEGDDLDEEFVCRKCIRKSKHDTSQIETLQSMLQNQAKLIDELVKEKMNSSAMVRRQSLQKLPKFNGNFTEWPMFKAVYDQTSQEGQFTDVENAIRLLEALEKPAKTLVEIMLANPTNLKDALTLLEQHYGNREIVYNKLIDDVLSAKPPRDGKRPTFIEFGVKISNLVNNLKIMAMEERFIDPRLIGDLMQKMSLAQQEKWISFAETQDATDLRVFDKFLQQRVIVLQQLRLGNDQPSNDRPNTSARGNVHVQISSEAEQTNCAVCNSTSHAVEKCNTFASLSPNSRWEKVKELRLCFGCLTRAKHRLNQCETAKVCQIDGCDRKHHKLLHNKSSQRSNGLNQNDSGPIKASNVSGTNLNVVNNKRSLFMIVPVTLSANGRTFDEYAFLDYGSSFTLIDSELAKNLELAGTPEPLTMFGPKRTVTSEEKSMRTSLKIGARNKNKQYNLCNARTVDDLNLPAGSMDAERLWANHQHLKGLPLPTYSNVTPKLLIGVNNPSLLAYHTVVEGPDGEPIAAKTKFGWCVFGETPGGSDNNRVMLLLDPSHDDDDKLHDLVKSYFTTESFGCKPLIDTQRSVEEERAQSIAHETLRNIGNRYEIGLLWKDENVTLPDSYPMAMKRLLYVENKMRKDPVVADWYVNQINDYLAKGYCRKLSNAEAKLRTPRTWFIPYFHVINANKVPPKIRLVFDAAAKVNGVSLNSALLPGPNTYRSLPGIIFKSREGAVCVAADIKEMFPQVKIRKEDQCSQRFLWRGGNTSQTPDIYEMTSMIFGACCSPYLAQVVKNENAKRFQHEHPDAVEAIINSHFVDDYLNSHNSVDEAITIAQQIVKIHKGAGFELRNFMSNSPEVMKYLPCSKEFTKEISSTDDTVNIAEKVLGVYWNIRSDKYEIKLALKCMEPDIVTFKRPPTKRELLRITMTIFDPLGLLSHALIRPRVIIQETWRAKIGWDSLLTEVLFRKWRKWYEEFIKLDNLTIPRAYSLRSNSVNRLEMHVFADASEIAFAAVVYFRFVFHDQVEVALVTSKAKVSPNKVLSIPRLELQAAVLGCRLSQFVESEHRIPIHRKYYWSDSQTVLSWITSSDPRKFKSFVAIRIGEIHDLSKPSEWQKIPTHMNVADDATKWSDNTTYDAESRWFNGPEFLFQPESSWPHLPIDIESTDDSSEIRRPVFLVHEGSLSFDAVPIEKFSSYFKLWKVLGYVIKFINSIRSKATAIWKRRTLTLVLRKQIALPVLSVDELITAEKLILKRAQLDAFPAEYYGLLNDDEIIANSSLYPLSPMIDDDGVIRVNSRIKRAPGIPPATRMPAILPNKHPITNMIIQWQHEKYAHQFHNSVIAKLRQKYAIIHIRRAVRRVTSQCQRCKNEKAKPIPTIMGELPLCRIDWGKTPFTHTGMDFFGPMDACIFKNRFKCYGAIFTCMVTRAVHLELVMSLSADDCIMSIRNFLNRRGPTQHIYCDNATNFHGARREMFEQIQNATPEIFMANDDNLIQWHFQPPTASHFGGAYERLIQSVKKSLQVLLLDRVPRLETLRSSLIEIENILNARPLTHIPLESATDEPLTPNHFIRWNANCLPAPGDFRQEVNLRKQWRITQMLANGFWKKWRVHYLPELTRRNKWYKKSPSLTVGDVVLIVDDNAPRNMWRKGLIVEMIEGPDQISRVAVVRANDKLYRRPIIKLAKLDVTPRE